MANPSDKVGQGPSGPIPEPSSTGTAAPSAKPGTAMLPAEAVVTVASVSKSVAGTATGAPVATPSGGYSPQTSAGQHSGRHSQGSAFAGTQEGASLGSGLKETAQTAADAVRQQAARFAEDVGHELSSTGEAQKARGVEAIRSFARAIDSAASELESQSPSVARTVHETARRVDSLSEQLANRNVNELLNSAAQFARTQPALFIGGSVAAGFALARFLKSSARQRSGSGHDGPTSYRSASSGYPTSYEPTLR